MKIKTDFAFPEQYRNEAEDYISYKHSLGFSFAYDDQKRLASLLKYLYENSTSNSVTELTKNLVDGYNDIVSQAKNSTATIIGTRATAMKNDAAGNKDALSEIGISYNSKNGTLSIDEKKFKAADKDKVKNLLGRDGSFGQRIRSNSTLIQSVAATAVRNSTTSAYGSNGLYGTNSLYGLMNSYGLGSSYGLTGNYGLSSFLGNWLA